MTQAEYNEAARLERLKELEEMVHADLMHYFTEAAKASGNHMFDPNGPTNFVLVCFNHVTDESLMPEDADSRDKSVAISASSNMIAPDVDAGPNGTTGPTETVHVGVHAVASSMLLSSLQQGPMVDAMKMAQQIGLKHHDKQRSLN